ncbi:MAG: hypothetical protein K2J86_08520, partial [Prevotella sp.]|nr:hypothetical protein [Prevotella sp.]
FEYQILIKYNLHICREKRVTLPKPSPYLSKIIFATILVLGSYNDFNALILFILYIFLFTFQLPPTHAIETDAIVETGKTDNSVTGKE